MPIILRNNTNSVEIDINPNLKYTVSKGAYDVIMEDTGNGVDTTAMVYVILHDAALIDSKIKIDWRDCYIEPGPLTFESAESLLSTLLEWNLQVVNVGSSALPSGAATEVTLAAIKAKTDNIPSDPAKESGKLTTIDSTLTAIKGKTDNIPSDPAKESGKLTTIDSTLSNIYIRQGDGNQKVKAKQDVVASSVNSSAVVLLAGATFTGLSESTLGIAAIQVMLKTDQNCTVYVDQSGDGTNWDITDSYTYYYSKGGESWTTQAVGSYYRIRVTNLSAIINTTYFRLSTALCPIVEAVPRALDEDGLFQTRVSKIKGDMGKVRISPMGAIKTAHGVRLVGQTIVDTVDSNYWISSGIVGAGAVSAASGEMTLTTGTPTVNGAIIVNSNRIARYIGGCPNYYRGNVVLPVVTTASAGFSNTRRWGAFNANDGYFFQAIQTNPATTPTLSIVSRKGTNDTTVTSFNGNYGSYFVLDNNVHTYEIWWTNKAAYFFIDDVLLHTIIALTTTAVGTPHLYVGLQTLNSGNNTAANTLVVRSSMIIRLGDLLTQPTSYYFAAGQTAGYNMKVGPGNLHEIIVNNETNNAVITISDSTSAATPIIWVHTAGATKSDAYELDFKGLPFFTGLRLTISGANASLTVIYE
jgi:hypothetical protein